MSNDAPKPTVQQPDDIDLFILIERAILFFKKYRWVFIIAVLAGLAAGFCFYKFIPKTYKSRMLVHSFTLANLEEIQIVKNWNQLLTKKEHQTLARIFDCDQAILQKVKKIKAEEIQQVFSQVNPNGFIIDVLVTDNTVLPALQQALVHGFENSPYITERLAMKRVMLKEIIDKTTVEILKLDSTKGQVEDIIGGKGKASSSLIVDGSSVNRQWIEMNEKLLNLKESLRFTSAVQVLQGFEAFRKPSGPHLLPWLVIGLLVFLSFAYLFALVSSINTTLKARARQRQVAP